MSDVVYSLGIHDAEILTALKRIDQNIAKIGKDGQQSFNSVSKSANLSAVQIGAISGLVSSLTTEFINLGKQAVTALAGLEVTEKTFIGIFRGNKAAAIAALDEIRASSRKLGADLTETASNFLPFVSSLEQLERIGKISASLTLAQSEQGSQGARIALQEALSGNARSLVQRFEIPKEFAQKLQDALDEGGVEAFLTEFEAVLKTLGKDLDSLGGGFQQASGKAIIAGQQIGQAFGGPILDELTKQFEDLNKTVSENFDDYELIADTFGRVLANVVDIVGSGLNDFLADLDTEQVISIGETLFDIVENARDFARVLGAAEVPQALLNGIESIATGLEKATDTAVKLTLILQAEWAKNRAELAKSQELGVGFAGPIQVGLTDENKAKIAAAGEEAYNSVIQKGVDILGESTARKEANRKATEDMAASQDNNANSALNEANAFLADADAARELEQAKTDAAEAQSKVDAAFAEAEKDHARKLEDIDIETARKRLEIQTEFAQKRVDQAKKNLEALADLETNYQNDVSAAATDLNRNEEDIARKHGREVLNLEREQRQGRLDIELEYQRQLSEITRQSNLDLDEAAQARDAVAFVKILKKRNEDITSAGADRNKQLADLQTTGEQKRETLRLQQEQELEDARIANERKLEDLRTNLEQQIEAQNTANQRALDDLTIAEERKNEALTLSQQQQIEDAQRAYERKLADLQTSLADELAIIAAANAATEAEQSRHIEAMNAINASYTPANAGFGANPGTIATSSGSPSRRGLGTGGVNVGSGETTPRRQPRSPGRRRAMGGPVVAGTSYVVGEDGPEVIVPTNSGTVIPNGAFIDVATPAGFGSEVSGSGRPPTPAEEAAGLAQRQRQAPSSPTMMSTFNAGGGSVSVSNNSETYNFPLVTADTILNDPISVRKITNIARNVVAESLPG